MGSTSPGLQVHAGLWLASGLVLLSGSFQSDRKDAKPPGARVTTHVYKMLGAQRRGGQW